MRPPKKRWRVRVLRRLEDWVEVLADDRLQAEQITATMPGIISVFSGSTISGEKPVMGNVPPVGIDEEEM